VRPPREGLVALILAIASGHPQASLAEAQDKFKLLNAADIRARVVSHDITDASHWSMYLRPDGTLIGTESNTRWTGTWRIQQNKLCMSNPTSKQLDCYDVWMAGEKISLRLKADDDSFVGVIERHKGN
jgi:hypothetical protein